MAKEIIPPDPIPIRSEEDKISDLYCTSYLGYSEESFSDITKELINYLKDEYSSNGLGGSTQSFMAHNTTMTEVRNNILYSVNGITNHNFDSNVILMQSGDDVMISVIVY